MAHFLEAVLVLRPPRQHILAASALDGGLEFLLLGALRVAAYFYFNEQRPPVDARDQIAGAGQAELDQSAVGIFESANVIRQAEAACLRDDEADEIAAIGMAERAHGRYLRYARYLNVCVLRIQEVSAISAACRR
jgi:hypothetical protein